MLRPAMSSSNLQIQHLEPRTLFAGFPISFGSKDFDAAYKVAATSDGGVVVAGLFSGIADFDPSGGVARLIARGEDLEEPEHHNNVFVARYSRTGGLVWVKQFAGNQGEIDSDNPINFAIDPARATNFDNGVGVMPALLGQYVNAMQIDSTGQIVLALSFRGRIDLDPGPGVAIFDSFDSRSFVDIALVKLNANGNLVFVKQIGGNFTDVAQGVALDAANNIYLTGYFTRTCDFDPSKRTFELTTFGREDIFVAKYTSAGALVWAKSSVTDEATRVNRSTGYSIAVDPATGNVFVTGSFAGHTDFDPGPVTLRIEAIDDTDIFIEKLSPAGDLVWVKTFGGDQFDGGLALALSPTDSSLVTVSFFEDTIDADPGPRASIVRAAPEEAGDDPKRSDLLIQKFGTGSGNLIWTRTLGNGGWETLGGLSVASNGNITTTGGFYGTIDFDPGRPKFRLRSTAGVEDFEDPNDGDRDDSYDVFLQTLTAGGTFVAATRFGGASDDYGTAISLDASDQSYVAGLFRGTYVFPNTTNKKLRPIGKQDGFVALFDTDHQIV
jgi:hypothetical protein